MRFGVLGPVAAWDADDTLLDVGSGRAAALLGLLLLADGPVPAGRLADQLWAGAPPASAPVTLQGWVSRLRRVLEPGVPANAASVLVTRGGAYEVVASELDLVAFRQLAATVAEHRSAGRLEQALTATASARSLWRSEEPFGGLLDDLAPGEVAALRVARDDLEESALRLRLDLGQHAAMGPDAGEFAAAHPLREAAVAICALALFRSERQAEALQVLAASRRLLRDELGLDPGAALSQVETAVLTQLPAARRPGWWPGEEALPPRAAGDSGVPTPDPNDAVHAPALPPRATGVQRAPTSAGLVGRDVELATLREATAGVAAGQPRWLMVSGGAGVGKTALLAEAFGPDSIWVRHAGHEDAEPFATWARLLGQMAPAPPLAPTSLRGWTRAVAAGLGDAVTQSDDGRLVVVLDDLQWADAASLGVLALLPAELAAPVTVAVVVREVSDGDADALTLAIAALSREPGLRLTLSPLTATAVADYVTRELGGQSAAVTGEALPAVAGAVAERSAGNAFFMTELVRLVASGRPPEELPDRVVDAISARAAELGEPARTLLRAAAVLGDDSRLDEVGSAVGLTSEELDKAVGLAVAAGLIEDDALVVRFPHALVRESLAARVTRRTGAQWHRSYASFRLAAGAAGETVAAHLLAGDDPRAAAAALAASRSALAQAAVGMALSWAERGLEASLRHGRSDEEQELLLTLGTALRRSGRLDEAATMLRQVHDRAVADRSDGADRAARAALELSGGAVAGYWSLALGGLVPGSLPVLRSARLRSGVRDETAVDLDLALAVQLGFAGDLPAARRHLDAARGSATAWRGQRAAALALADFVVHYLPAEAGRRLVLLEELTAGVGDDLAAQLGLQHLLAIALLEAGRASEADEVAARLLAAAEREHYDEFRLVGRLWEAMRLLRQGDLTAAMSLAQSTFGAGGAPSGEAARALQTTARTIAGLVAWEQRSLADLASSFAAAPTEHRGWAIVGALALAQAGRHEESRDLVASALTDDGPSPADSPHRVAGTAMGSTSSGDLDVLGEGRDATVSVVLLTEWSWETRDSTWARQLARRLAPLREGVVTLGVGAVCMGSGRLYTGTAALLAGEHEQARRDLTLAAATDDRLGMPRFAARARERLATLRPSGCC